MYILIFFDGDLNILKSRLNVIFNNEENRFVKTITNKYPCIKNPDDYQIAQVTKIIDGDSIEIDLEGDLYQVRYIGIDAPEFTNDERIDAEKARLANRLLVEGKQVILYKDISETDRYGRLLRYVFVDEIFVNYEMVFKGYAESKSYFPDISCQKILEIDLGK